MATVKNISGDWYVTVNGGVGTIYVDGSLDVSGNITYVSEIAVNDAFIVVAANNTGTVTDMGLIAQTSNTTFAGFRFDTSANAWQVSSSVYANGTPISAYQTVSSGGAGIPGGAVNDIQYNNGTGGFAGNSKFQLDSANSIMTISGAEVLSNIGTAPTAVANSVAIYNNAPGPGATGLYTVGTTTTADEVISLTRARLYSIIF